MTSESGDSVAYSAASFQSHPLATAEGNHAQLYLRIAATDSIRSLRELGCPVTYVWRPDRVERHMRYEHLDFSSVTRIAARSDAMLIDLLLHNSSPDQTKALDLFLRLLSGVEKLEDTSVWNTVTSPLAATRYDASRRAFMFSGLRGPLSVGRAAWDLMPSAVIENVIVGGTTYRIAGGALEQTAT